MKHKCFIRHAVLKLQSFTATEFNKVSSEHRPCHNEKVSGVLDTFLFSSIPENGSREHEVKRPKIHQ